MATDEEGGEPSLQAIAETEARLLAKEKEFATGREGMREAQREEVQALKEEGNAAFRKGKLADAIERYTEAIDVDFQFGDDEKVTAVLYSNRAAAYLKQAEVGWDEAWEQAERDCCRAIERDATAKYLLRHAKACEGLERINDAFESLATAVVHEPTNKVVLKEVERLREQHDNALRPSEGTLQKLRKRAAARAERGADQQARAFQDAIELLEVSHIEAATTD